MPGAKEGMAKDVFEGGLCVARETAGKKWKLAARRYLDYRSSSPVIRELYCHLAAMNCGLSRIGFTFLPCIQRRELPILRIEGVSGDQTQIG